MGLKKHLNIKWVIWVQETLSNIPIREPKNEPPLGRAGPKSVRGWLALRSGSEPTGFEPGSGIFS